jgi:hypothetical protein
MKRYVCTVAAGLLLALVSTGTATAGGLPDLGQTATQVSSFGDQTVGKQSNDADVTQAQGNGNVNVSPAIAILGDAETSNEQGNDNTATADVDQSNSVEQSQSSTQKQLLGESGGACCGGQSQAGEQKTSFGDQYVGKQRNDAGVRQWQGNGNVNVSPAIAVFGDAKTRNEQGDGNSADASVTQSNDASQSQSSTQKQSLGESGGTCCKAYDCERTSPCTPKKEYGERSKSCEPKHPAPKGKSCSGGQSQAGKQKTFFGDQEVGEQKNTADVTQKQGNGNVNVSPAIALGGDKHESCRSKCKGSWKPSGGKAETTNEQGNGNTATANVDQSNSVEQSQQASQRQSIVDECKGLIHR